MNKKNSLQRHTLEINSQRFDTVLLNVLSESASLKFVQETLAADVDVVPPLQGDVPCLEQYAFSQSRGRNIEALPQRKNSLNKKTH